MILKNNKKRRLKIKKIFFLFLYFFTLIDAKLGLPDIRFQKNSLAYFYLDTPGDYFLSEHINVKSQSSYRALIVIDSNDVTLDLNNFILSQSDSIEEIFGIEIMPNLSNVKIKGNGVIRNINGVGIKVNKNCRNIEISNLVISNCKSAGLLIDSSSRIDIHNIDIVDCGFLDGDESVVGLGFYNCGGIVSNKIFVLDNKGDNANGFGLLLDNCQNCYFEDCNSSLSSGISSYAYCLRNNSSSCTFKNCEAKNNRGKKGEVVGFLVDNSASNLLEGCVANSNGIDKGTTYGFKLVDSKYNILRNCKSINQSSKDGSCYGFYTWSGTSNLFDDCESIGNNSKGLPEMCVGFALRGKERFTRMEKCTAQNNNANDGNGFGLMIGFWGEDVQDCFIINNRFISNIGAITSYGLKEFSYPNVKNLWIQNFSYGHGKVRPGPFSVQPNDSRWMNYWWNFTSDTHPPNRMVFEPSNLARPRDILVNNSLVNISFGDD